MMRVTPYSHRWSAHWRMGNTELGLPVRPRSQSQCVQTSGYATWFTAGDAIRIAHYDVIDDVLTRKL